MLTAKRLREAFNYDPYSGLLTWKVKRPHVHTGDVAGSINKITGYRMIQIDGEQVLAHRAIWLMMTGHWPLDIIDHINRRRDDNRFINLREATHSQNHGNMGPQRNNTSGVKGVCWHKRDKRWQVYIGRGSKRSYIGQFRSIDDAKEAYINAARVHFGEFATDV